MANETNEWISADHKDYPHVARLVDPLLVRLNELTLQVGNTVFFAKIKYGNNFKGYLVYISGLGTPIIERNFDNNEIIQASTNVMYGGGNTSAAEAYRQGTSKLSQAAVIGGITKYAKDWLDKLEDAIANFKESNGIKAAIDRLNWQIHFDTTGSSTDLPTELKDFADVDIDNGSLVQTIPETVNDAAHTISGGDSHEPAGTLSQVVDKLGDIESNLDRIKSSISTVGDTESTEESLYYAIRGDGAYSVVTALRESNQNSVSQAVNDQTNLERTHFEDVEGRIGTPNTSDNQSVWNTLLNINGGQAAQSNSVFARLTQVNTDIGTLSDVGTDTVFGYLSNTYDKATDIKNNIGTPASGSTITSIVSGTSTTVSTMNEKMNGDGTNCGYVTLDSSDPSHPQYRVITDIKDDSRITNINNKVNEFNILMNGDGTSPGYVVKFTPGGWYTRAYIE